MSTLVHVLPVPWSSYDYTLRIIRMLNLPGDLLQLPITLFRENKVDWHPAWMSGMLWAAISWPVLALVFWWMAGRAVDALVALKSSQPGPRITLIEAIVGGVLMLGGVVTVAGLAADRPADIYSNATTGFVIAAGGLWAVLGGTSVVARFRQWRLRRTLGKSAVGAA